MTSISDKETVLANPKRIIGAFLNSGANQKAFVKFVQDELARVATALSDDTTASITLAGTTYDDKTSQGALLAITNYTSQLSTVTEGFNGIFSSIDNLTNQIRQLVRS